MNIHFYGADDYMWNSREEGKCYIAIFDDNTIEIVVAKNKDFILKTKNGSSIVTHRVKGITDKDNLTVSIGYYGEKIKDYKLGEK